MLENEKPTLRTKVGEWVESARVRNFIITLIIINAITLGLELSPNIMARYGAILETFDDVILGVFVLEIALKLYAFGWRFWKSGWNVFDFLIVGIALMPASGVFSVLRVLRILRVLRLHGVTMTLYRRSLVTRHSWHYLYPCTAVNFLLCFCRDCHEIIWAVVSRMVWYFGRLNVHAFSNYDLRKLVYGYCPSHHESVSTCVDIFCVFYPDCDVYHVESLCCHHC